MSIPVRRGIVLTSIAIRPVHELVSAVIRLAVLGLVDIDVDPERVKDSPEPADVHLERSSRSLRKGQPDPPAPGPIDKPPHRRPHQLRIFTCAEELAVQKTSATNSTAATPSTSTVSATKSYSIHRSMTAPCLGMELIREGGALQPLNLSLGILFRADWPVRAGWCI
jgi:hypothetical protein